ncbi:DUF4347 domain-containing protein [Methylocucumis oryzae]|uniref:DUF4347 domain-containing protein n=1 Tax=Methylocucumis oryzae TaxID=1632867 RepID=A0A0F3IK51_9GAMM|nr:DUF4347 domain-containing protein [Methylocucumis oryzae]KJV05959.1 hypothetical protein VZ94_14485 [Methylocucumis oryzae]
MTKRVANKDSSTTKTSAVLLALEPRFMFDAAGAATGADLAADQVAQQQVDLALPKEADSPNQSATTESEPSVAAEDSTSAAHAETTTTQPTVVDNTASLLSALSLTSLPTSEVKQEWVFIDTSVKNYTELLSSISPNAQIVLLDQSQDGLTQIATALKDSHDVDAIHIISHGSEGRLYLAGSEITEEQLSRDYDDELETIKNALNLDADILLYGCDLADDLAGERFINTLSALTGADVAASLDATGAEALGGDWTLEASTGAIETASLVFADYASLLAAPVITDSVGTRSVAEQGNLAITGISISDTDGDAQTVTITVTNGTLNLASTTGLSGLTGNGTNNLSFTGSLTNVNNALNGMTFTPTADFNGTATVALNTNDGTTNVNQKRLYYRDGG